jgi:murein DD-endopeptidase MepM/ murein hydrolase activator NlpD
MTGVRGYRALLLLALFASFGAGVLVDGWLRTSDPLTRVPSAAQLPQTPAGPLVVVAPLPETYLADPARQPAMAAAPAVTAAVVPTTRLRVPIDGISIESFKGGFAETRSGRPHEAVDIVVPRGTPVHAVQDGTIAKLFLSKPGGITIYQFDPNRWLCFYYAHLDRYADLLHEGQHVSQGEVIGYVGSTGNAAPDSPHLHFGVTELNADRKWWQGRALDPYQVFKEKG